MMILDRLRRSYDPTLPYDMFDARYTDAEARRARRMESIYHVGQEKIWNGKELLRDLIAKHGKPCLPPNERRALARVFAIIMWGELAAWRISAQLSDRLVPLEAKLAAASQVHDEARHFYVMHDYLEALGEKPKKMEFWARRVVEMTLGTDDLVKKLLGMQLTIEMIALVIFQRVRELRAEPVLCELLTYFEKDEARHVGLGVQMLPPMFEKMSVPRATGVALFQLDLLVSAIISLKTIEPDLALIGVDPRTVLGIGFRKQAEIDSLIKQQFPLWPEDPPVRRVFEAICEILFPSEGQSAKVPLPVRVAHAVEVARRLRPSVVEAWGTRAHAA
jgi:hypothetical protein